MFALEDSSSDGSYLDRAIELLEKVFAEVETQSIAPVEAIALRKRFLEVRRLAEAGRDSVLRAHPRTGEEKGPC